MFMTNDYVNRQRQVSSQNHLLIPFPLSQIPLWEVRGTSFTVEGSVSKGEAPSLRHTLSPANPAIGHAHTCQDPQPEGDPQLEGWPQKARPVPPGARYLPATPGTVPVGRECGGDSMLVFWLEMDVAGDANTGTEHFKELKTFFLNSGLGEKCQETNRLLCTGASARADSKGCPPKAEKSGIKAASMLLTRQEGRPSTSVVTQDTKCCKKRKKRKRGAGPSCG